MTASPATSTWSSPASALIFATLSLGVPILLAAWLRTRAIRAIERDADTAWFGYARLAQWIALGAWLAWLAAVSATPLLRGVMRPLAGFGLPWMSASICFLCMAPPALAALVIQAMVHDVRRRASATRLTLGEALRASAWQMSASLIPLSFVVVGALGFVLRQSGLGLMCLVAALLSRLWLLRRAMQALGTIPQAVTSGPLRDRIFALAERAKVKLKQIYVLPMARLNTANAFAVTGGTVMLSDVLLMQFSEREVLAIMAHEVAHLKHDHPRRIARASMFAALAPMFTLGYLAARHLFPLWLAICGSVLLGLFVTQLVRRRFEYEADATAIEIGGDPAALASGLVRLSALNHMPLHWGRWTERSLTHPSTRRRIRRIAERAQIGEEELNRWMTAPGPTDSRSEIPASLDSGRLFVTGWKLRVSSNIGLMLISLHAGIPALVMWALRDIAPALGGHPGAILIGTLGVMLAVLGATDLLSVSPARGLERRMAERFAARGVPTGQPGAVFVGLSPTREPRIYENTGDWDLGFLVRTDDRLCFFGEETQFTLERGRVAEIGLTRGLPSWISAPRVMIAWRDANGETHEFTLRPAHVRSLSATAGASRRLAAELNQWRGGSAAGTSAVAAPAGAPPTAPVTSASPGDLVGAATTVRAIVLVMIFTGAIGSSIGLSWSFARPGLLDAALAATLGVLIVRVPYWIPGRREQLERERETSERAA